MLSQILALKFQDFDHDELIVANGHQIIALHRKYTGRSIPRIRQAEKQFLSIDVFGEVLKDFRVAISSVMIVQKKHFEGSLIFLQQL